MNRTRLLMIGVLALALGAFVSYSVYRTLQSKTGGGSPPGADVVVATNDLQVGARVEDRDVRIIKIPATDVPPGAYDKKSKVLGRGVVIPIAKGEFLLPTKLAGENAGSGLPALIPPGMRAMSVRVNEVVSVAGFVGPGTRVDVLLTGTPKGGGEQETTTVLQNVAVIASGQKLERNAAGEPMMTPVITLLVSPEDAQKLTLASAEGKIQLALRNPLDTRQDDLAAAHAAGLYNKAAVPTAAAAPRVRVVKKPPETTALPTVYSVQIIKGNKTTETTFK